LGSVLQVVDVAFEQGIEDRGKLRALRNVLVKKGSWPGTKVQIKPMFRRKKTEVESPILDAMPGVDEIKESVVINQEVGDSSEENHTGVRGDTIPSPA
jgi:inositol-hexakisphosphate/diphosphoinositol-pentakisphosphate 1-kinase